MIEKLTRGNKIIELVGAYHTDGSACNHGKKTLIEKDSCNTLPLMTGQYMHALRPRDYCESCR